MVQPVYAPVPRLSKGHAVALSPVRENVYFWQSGAASWDHFTIVGPGKINGHQGWVNGHLGLNTAVYGGLQAHHGYTVFYQPVTGPGSTTPVPGSHWGLALGLRVLRELATPATGQLPAAPRPANADRGAATLAGTAAGSAAAVRLGRVEAGNEYQRRHEDGDHRDKQRQLGRADPFLAAQHEQDPPDHGDEAHRE